MELPHDDGSRNAPKQAAGNPPDSYYTAETRSIQFHSILYRDASDQRGESDTAETFRDLHLDQIIEAITLGRQEYNLVPFFRHPLTDLDAIKYRQEVMRDLEDAAIMRSVVSFSERMQSMRRCLNNASNSNYRYERERWFLDAAGIYCSTLTRLLHDLSQSSAASRGMRAFRAYVNEYLQTTSFKAFEAETKKLTDDLSRIRYSLLIREGKVTVGRYAGETDYSAAIEQTFEKFRRGAVREYLAQLPARSGMNHIQAQVLEGVAQLYPETFRALILHFAEYAAYPDATIARFDREIQFYVAYLDYLQRFLRPGLRFCYPQLSATSRELVSHEAFDMALAGKRLEEKAQVITNSFFLHGRERLFVVSGPNQGGKTTFARMFGQLHYIARLGCQVPGTQANLFLCDGIFTHFEREEDIKHLRGKLHQDLVRIREIINRITPNSIVIMNELFSSTTLEDAVFLSKQIMKRLCEVGVLGVWVTFLTELATFNEMTVSTVSTVIPNDPATRTFKLERRPAEGITYAITVAEKHRLTYSQIRERLQT